MKKEVVLLIEDSVYERFMGMVSLCPQVEVVSETKDGAADLDADYCMACAIRELNRGERRSLFLHPDGISFLSEIVGL